MSNNKFNKYNIEKNLLQNLLKQLLDKNLTKIEKNSKIHLSILSSSKETQTKMSNILSNVQKQINTKKHYKNKLNNEKINKSNKDLYHFHNNSKIKTNLFNHINKKNNIINSINHIHESHKNQSKNISRNKKVNKTKSKSKINYFKKIQNNYLINLYGDNINIISNDDKINYNNINNRSKSILKKANTMFNLYKKGIKKDNRMVKNHNISSEFKSNNNSSIDISEIFARNIRKKNTIDIKKNTINNISSKNEKKLNKKNLKRRKTPFNLRQKSCYDIKLKTENEININKSIKIKHIYETENIHFKESKIIDDIQSLNSSINKDELMIINYNLLDLDEENSEKDEEIIKKNSLLKNKKNKNSRNIKNVKKEETYSYNLVEFINNEFFNYILEYLSVEDLLKLKSASKLCNNLIINYFIDKFEKEKKIFNKKISTLKLALNQNNIIIDNYKISLDSLQINKTSEKAISLLNEDILNKLFYNNIYKIPSDDILLIYRIFFYIINHPIKYNDKQKFWENCKNYFINESNGKIGSLLFDIIKNKKICLNGRNVLNIYNLAENNLDKLIPSYFSKICGTTGLFVFFIKEILDFLGITKDKSKITNFFGTYNIIINFLNEKIFELKKIQK